MRRKKKPAKRPPYEGPRMLDKGELAKFNAKNAERKARVAAARAAKAEQ